MVIDSIACPFRHGFEDMGMRNRVLGRITQNLILLATTRNAAVHIFCCCFVIVEEAFIIYCLCDLGCADESDDYQATSTRPHFCSAGPSFRLS